MYDFLLPILRSFDVNFNKSDYILAMSTVKCHIIKCITISGKVLCLIKVYLRNNLKARIWLVTRMVLTKPLFYQYWDYILIQGSSVEAILSRSTFAWLSSASWGPFGSSTIPTTSTSLGQGMEPISLWTPAYRVWPRPLRSCFWPCYDLLW